MTSMTLYGPRPYDPFLRFMPMSQLVPGASMKRSLRASKPLPDDLPDYMVYMTRNALLTVTEPLADAFKQIHDFFMRVSQMLAFERLIRSMTPWPLQNAAFGAYGFMPQWLAPVKAEAPLLPFWGPKAVPALPKPAAGSPGNIGAIGSDGQAASIALCAAIMAIPASLLSFAPVIAEAWRMTI